MEEIAKIDIKINHIMHEIVELKKALIPLKIKAKNKNNTAWNDLMAASDEITELWNGKPAVEEMRDQREKVW